jgi:hypothetical protein
MEVVSYNNKDCPMVLQAMNLEEKINVIHIPFFIILLVNDLLLHNCMLDSRVSTNVMSLKVMNYLGLKTIRSYKKKNHHGFKRNDGMWSNQGSPSKASYLLGHIIINGCSYRCFGC